MAKKAQRQQRHTAPAKNRYQPPKQTIAPAAHFIFKPSFNVSNSTLAWVLAAGLLTRTVIVAEEQTCSAVANPLTPAQARHPISHAVTSLNRTKSSTTKRSNSAIDPDQHAYNERMATLQETAEKYDNKQATALFKNHRKRKLKEAITEKTHNTAASIANSIIATRERFTQSDEVKSFYTLLHVEFIAYNNPFEHIILQLDPSIHSTEIEKMYRLMSEELILNQQTYKFISKEFHSKTATALIKQQAQPIMALIELSHAGIAYSDPLWAKLKNIVERDQDAEEQILATVIEPLFRHPRLKVKRKTLKLPQNLSINIIDACQKTLDFYTTEMFHYTYIYVLEATYNRDRDLRPLEQLLKRGLFNPNTFPFLNGAPDEHRESGELEKVVAAAQFYPNPDPNIETLPLPRTEAEKHNNKEIIELFNKYESVYSEPSKRQLRFVESTLATRKKIIEAQSIEDFIELYVMQLHLIQTYNLTKPFAQQVQLEDKETSELIIKQCQLKIAHQTSTDEQYIAKIHNTWLIMMAEIAATQNKTYNIESQQLHLNCAQALLAYNKPVDALVELNFNITPRPDNLWQQLTELTKKDTQFPHDVTNQIIKPFLTDKTPSIRLPNYVFAGILQSCGRYLKCVTDDARIALGNYVYTTLSNEHHDLSLIKNIIEVRQLHPQIRLKSDNGDFYPIDIAEQFNHIKALKLFERHMLLKYTAAYWLGKILSVFERIRDHTLKVVIIACLYAWYRTGNTLADTWAEANADNDFFDYCPLRSENNMILLTDAPMKSEQDSDNVAQIAGDFRVFLFYSRQFFETKDAVNMLIDDDGRVLLDNPNFFYNKTQVREWLTYIKLHYKQEIQTSELLLQKINRFSLGLTVADGWALNRSKGTSTRFHMPASLFLEQSNLQTNTTFKLNQQDIRQLLIDILSTEFECHTSEEEGNIIINLTNLYNLTNIEIAKHNAKLKDRIIENAPETAFKRAHDNLLRDCDYIQRKLLQLSHKTSEFAQGRSKESLLLNHASDLILAHRYDKTLSPEYRVKKITTMQERYKHQKSTVASRLYTSKDLLHNLITHAEANYLLSILQPLTATILDATLAETLPILEQKLSALRKQQQQVEDKLQAVVCSLKLLDKNCEKLQSTFEHLDKAISTIDLSSGGSKYSKKRSEKKPSPAPARRLAVAPLPQRRAERNAAAVAAEPAEAAAAAVAAEVVAAPVLFHRPASPIIESIDISHLQPVLFAIQNKYAENLTHSAFAGVFMLITLSRLSDVVMKGEHNCHKIRQHHHMIRHGIYNLLFQFKEEDIFGDVFINYIAQYLDERPMITMTAIRNIDISESQLIVGHLCHDYDGGHHGQAFELKPFEHLIYDDRKFLADSTDQGNIKQQVAPILEFCIYHACNLYKRISTETLEQEQALIFRAAIHMHLMHFGDLIKIVQLKYLHLIVERDTENPHTLNLSDYDTISRTQVKHMIQEDFGYSLDIIKNAVTVANNLAHPRSDNLSPQLSGRTIKLLSSLLEHQEQLQESPAAINLTYQ